MSKKNFIDGMDSIFTDSSEKSIQEEGSSLFSYETKSVRDPGELVSAGKFSSVDNLDDEYEEYDESATKEKKPLSKSAAHKTHKKTIDGVRPSNPKHQW